MTLDPLSFALGVAAGVIWCFALARLERWLDRRAGPAHPIPGEAKAGHVPPRPLPRPLPHRVEPIGYLGGYQPERTADMQGEPSPPPRNL